MAAFEKAKGDYMKTFLRVLSILCLIAWMGLIFFLSSQDAEESSAVSGGLIKTVVEKVYPNYENLTEDDFYNLCSFTETEKEYIYKYSN